MSSHEQSQLLEDAADFCPISSKISSCFYREKGSSLEGKGNKGCFLDHIYIYKLSAKNILKKKGKRRWEQYKVSKKNEGGMGEFLHEHKV